MFYLHLIFGGLLAAIVVYFIYIMWRDYNALSDDDKKNWKDHIWALGKGSATKVWMRIVGIVGAALGGLAQLADVLQLPQVSEFIQAWLKPEYVSVAMLVIALVGVVARSRTQPADEKSVL